MRRILSGGLLALVSILAAACEPSSPPAAPRTVETPPPGASEWPFAGDEYRDYVEAIQARGGDFIGSKRMISDDGKIEHLRGREPAPDRRLYLAVEIRREGPIPLYRLRVQPMAIPAWIRDGWRDVMKLRVGNTTFYARLPDERMAGTWMNSPWTLCLSCVGREPDGREAPGPSPAAKRYAVEDLGAGARLWFTYRFQDNLPPGILSGDAAVAEARRLAARLEGDPSPAARRDYEALRRAYRDSNPARRLDEVCEDDLMADYEWRAVLAGDVDYAVSLDRLERRMPRLLDCADGVLAGIDWARRAEEVAEIAARERTLAEVGELRAADRFQASPAGEIEQVEDWFAEQQSGYRIGASEIAGQMADERDVERHRARQRAAADAAWARLAADPLGDWRRRTQAQMADLADFNARVERMADRGPRALPSVSSPASPSADAEAKARRRESEANRAEMETRARMAEAEDRDAAEDASGGASPRAEAAGQGAQPEADDQPTWSEALVGEDEPRRGGMEGCVEVIETRKSTGSSALSSCSYDEPDRPSMTLVYQNNCGFPVDVETRIALDTGESDVWTEYAIKPGRRRTTADLCGLISYEFGYVEND